MAEGKQKPGVMIYFDNIRPALNRLNDEQCGSLFRAILDYAEYGVIADLEPITGMVFDLLRPKIDRDSDRYEESREQRQHAVYAREAKRRGEQPLSFSEWRVYRAASNDNGPIIPDNDPYPSTSTSTTTSPSITPSTSPTVSTTTAGKGTEKGSKGKGRGKPDLSAEVSALFDEWGREMDSKHAQNAGMIANQLYGLGYVVDRETREIKPR